MKITATTEKKPQTIGEWFKYDPSNSSWYGSLRLVGWISQNNVTGKTTLYTKWQRNQYNYYVFWNDSHTYSVTLNGTTKSDSFALPLVQQNGVYDLTAKQSITVTHTDAYTGTMTVSLWEPWNTSATSASIAVEFPAITIVTPDPQDTDEPSSEPPAEVDYNGSPYFYIYVDGDLLYMAGLEERFVQNPKLTVEVNKAGSLTFSVPPTSDMYSAIKLLTSTIDVYKGNKVLWRGRPMEVKRDIRLSRSWYCEGFLSWLGDKQFLPTNFTGKAKDLCKDFMARYNSRTSDERMIVYEYSDIATDVVVKTDKDADAWSEFKRIFIDGIGAIVVPYLTATETGIQLLSAGSKISSQTVEFGKNLIDYDDCIDASEIFTAVRPYGKDENGNQFGLTGGSSFVADSAALRRYGRIERTVYFDEITTEEKLRTAAQQYLQTGINEALTISVKAVDLQLLGVEEDEIEVGDYVRIISKPHELDAYFLCSKIVYYLDQPEKNTYTFGGVLKTISEQVKTDNGIKYVVTEG